ncbi:serine-rich adhesin for platelets-like [Haliotis cracherodii]|uniref:serine-rich adhesin for platelets-like n=1 Tax=Haliotis cracherodii TaxID=6455 RepID=UPI0039ECFDF5
MATNNIEAQQESLSGSDGSSVKRILNHVDRLLAFNKVEWFLHEQRKDTILKLDFIQDRKYTNVFQTSDALPRVNDHISRLTKSHKLKEWSLREGEGCASIIIAFQYDNCQSAENLFFLNTEHLKLVSDLHEHKDSHRWLLSDTLSVECQCKCNPRVSDKGGRILTEKYSTPPTCTHPLSHCAPHGTVPNQIETDTLSLSSPVNQSDVQVRQLPLKEKTISSKTPAQKPYLSAVASSSKTRRDVKSESENTAKSFKNKFPSKISKNVSTKKPQTTQNPFSVTGSSANQNNAIRKSKSIYAGNSLRPLHRSKSTSGITMPRDTTHRNGKKINATSQVDPEPTATKFTFSKEYRKMKKPSAVNLSNVSVKRKHERSDHITDTEDHVPGPNCVKPGPQSIATKESSSSDKVGQKEVVSYRSSHLKSTHDGKGSYPVSSDEHGSPIGDIYRLYFADSADTSMYNNDAFWSSTDRTQNSKSSSAIRQTTDMHQCSTPSMKPGGHASLFGELMKKFFSEAAENTSDIKAATDLSKCQYNISNFHQAPSDVTTPRNSRTESDSSIDDNPQDATLTEASQTDCDMFSCCTEPCLDESVKEEIQDYYVKIYNQIQSEPRVETVQLVWQINEDGRICLYHKYLKQVKSHDLVSPEELQDLEKSGSHSVIPRIIRQQYIFRRLLDELDQVTFDNRPLTNAEKKRLDKFMTSEAGCT